MTVLQFIIVYRLGCLTMICISDGYKMLWVFNQVAAASECKLYHLTWDRWLNGGRTAAFRKY